MKSSTGGPIPASEARGGSRRRGPAVATVTAAVALSVLVTSVLAAPVRADDVAAPATDDGGYRQQVLAAGLASVAAFGGGVGVALATQKDTVLSNGLLLAGGFGYLLGGPAVHVAHERYGRAVGSLALRFALPIVGAGIGAMLATCSGNELVCGGGEMAAGMAAGVVAASAIDVGFIAAGSWPDRPAPARPAPAPMPAPGRLSSISPRLVATPELAFVGVGGRF